MFNTKQLPPAVIFDLDGCLCHCIPQSRFDWDNYDECARAMWANKPNIPIINLANLVARGCRLIIVTGRPERYRAVTETYLDTYMIPRNELIMRPDDSILSDANVKRDILRVLRIKYDIWFTVEDRDSVVKMWREEGLLCFQCAEGNY